MDSIQKIAISNIADILSNGYLLFPAVDNWKKIFYNAGQSELYESNEFKLREKEVEENWKNNYYNNERTYSAILVVLTELVEESKQFVKMLNSIATKISIYRVFQDDIESKLKKGYSSTHFDVCDYLTKKDLHVKREMLKQYSSKTFKQLQVSLNILSLDITFDDDLNLIVTPFSITGVEGDVVKSAVVLWLEDYYPNILESYENAVRMCGEGNPPECLSDCRNVITGIFSYSKREGTGWYTGLQFACSADKNIQKIGAPNNIPSWQNGTANSGEENKRYNYPRFKTICQIYSFLSDLGPHKDEANIVNGIVDYEIPTQEDALWGLRMTENILVWLYQNQDDNL